MITPAILTALFLYLGGIIGYIGAIFCFLDMIGRVVDFIRAKKSLTTNLDVVRVCKTYASSHCSRQSVWLAARYISEAKARQVSITYRSLGKRWYHLLPNWITTPWIILKPKFWIYFVGIK